MKMSIKPANISSIEHEIIRKLAIKSGYFPLLQPYSVQAETGGDSHLFRSGYIGGDKSEEPRGNLLDFSGFCG